MPHRLRAPVPTLRNVGRLDSAVRVLAGIWLASQGLAAADRPFLAIAWGGLGLFVLATGLLRVCPVYTLVQSLRATSSTPRRP